MKLRYVLLSAFLCAISISDANFVFVLSLVVILTRLLLYNKIIIKFAVLFWPLILLCWIGLVIGVLSEELYTWPLIRDFYYLVRIPVISLAAVSFCADDLDVRTITRVLLLSAFCVSLFYIFQYYSFDGSSLTRRDLRTQVGRGFVLSTIGLAILLLYWRHAEFDDSKSQLGRMIAIFTCALAIYLSDSRTLPFLFSIFFICYFISKYKIICMTAYSFSILLFLFFSVPDFYTYFSNSSFFGANLSELFSSSFSSYQSVQANYRSYETIQAWTYFKNFDLVNQFLGAGFGTPIPIDIMVELGQSDSSQSYYTDIPVTHNSFLTVLVKTGLVGALLYCLMLAAFIFYTKSSNQLIAGFNIALHFVLLYGAFTFQGLFAKIDLISITMTVIVLLYTTSRISAKKGAA